MNVNLPNNKIDKKSIIVYSVIIGICVISIFLVLYSQFFQGKTVTTVGNLKGKSTIGYEELKAEFDDLFTNSLQKYDQKYSSKKADSSKELVYTGYTNTEKSENNYNLDVNIPYINIENEKIDKFNSQMKNIFQRKAEEILKTENKNAIYTVEYSAYIQDGILSIIIRANLKEGANAHRVIVKTFNYSLEEEKEVSLKSLLDLSKVEESYVQKRIDAEIKSEQKKAEDLKTLGYQIYERDVTDEKYQVANVEEFFYHDGSIYIIFAYGNDKYTSEVDIAIV